MGITSRLAPTRMFQIVELPVTERDIEKEHLAQLRRWKETRGDLHCKSPPRMHGAKAIIKADPPSRQDLRQRPAIIVESPLASKMDVDTKERKKTKEEVIEKETILPPQETVISYPPSNDPSPLLKQLRVKGSKESLSSVEHDTYL